MQWYFGKKASVLKRSNLPNGQFTRLICIVSMLSPTSAPGFFLFINTTQINTSSLRAAPEKGRRARLGYGAPHRLRFEAAISCSLRSPGSLSWWGPCESPLTPRKQPPQPPFLMRKNGLIAPLPPIKTGFHQHNQELQSGAHADAPNSQRTWQDTSGSPLPPFSFILAKRMDPPQLDCRCARSLWSIKGEKALFTRPTPPSLLTRRE